MFDKNKYLLGYRDGIDALMKEAEEEDILGGEGPGDVEAELDEAFEEGYNAALEEAGIVPDDAVSTEEVELEKDAAYEDGYDTAVEELEKYAAGEGLAMRKAIGGAFARGGKALKRWGRSPLLGAKLRSVRRGPALGWAGAGAAGYGAYSAYGRKRRRGARRGRK